MTFGEGIPLFTATAATLTATRHLGLLFPRRALVARVARLDAIEGSIIPSGSEALRLLASYVRAIQARLALDNAKLEETVAGHIYDLAALVLDPHAQDREASLGAVAAARLAGALAAIGQRFTESDLGLTAIALSQNVSPRYLQRLLETTGKPFSVHVNELRLVHALALLRDGSDPRRIAEIALAAGFSDISYFNRLFRARFGDTPTGVRAAARRVADR